MMKRGFFALFLFLCIGSFASENLAGSDGQKRNWQTELKPFIREDGPNRIGYLHVERNRSIDNTTYLYVKFALEEFRKQNVCFVLLDLDTPGGEVFSALRIADELRKMDLAFHIPVVAYVDPWALSAGALLAYSCRFIGARQGANMGAAEPIVSNGDGQMQTASEKIISALRMEFANAAEQFGRNPMIAEAMVDKDLILVLREDKVVPLRNDTQILESDHVITTQGKLLTLNAEMMLQLSIANFIVPAFSSYGEGKSFQSLGLDSIPFFAKIQNPILIGYSNWKISFFSFLTHPFVSSLLMIGLMIGIYGEMQNPGFGVFGVVGISCFFLILLSSFSLEVVSWLEMLMIVLGMLLFFSDLLFLSGFGFLGALGALLMLIGLAILVLPPLKGYSFPMMEWGVRMQEFIYRLSVLLSSIFIAFIGMLFLGRIFSKRKVFMRHLVLKEGREESKPKNYLPNEGTKGKAYTSLRPFGKVLIGDRVYEAQAIGEFIDRGEPVYIVSNQEDRMIVSTKEK